MSERPAVRQRRRPDAARPNPETKSDDGPSEPSVDSVTRVKLETLLVMILQGRSQAEMARHFGVTDRTIRNWTNELEALQPSIGPQLEPVRYIAGCLARYRAREVELLVWKREAEQAGEHKRMLDCVKELRQLDESRQRFLERAGIFKSFRLEPLISDPTKRDADSVAETIALLMSSHSPGDAAP